MTFSTSSISSIQRQRKSAEVTAEQWNARLRAQQAAEHADSDEAMMSAYRDGNEQALECIYQRHQGALQRYFQRAGLSPMVSEDLAHEVWMSIMRTRDHYRVEAKFTTYLYRVAHCRLIDQFRHAKTSLALDLDDPDELLNRLPADLSNDPLDVVNRDQRQQRLQAAIEQLPQVQRDAFRMRLETGMTVEKIATSIGVPAETVKSRLRYATSKLRNLDLAS